MVPAEGSKTAKICIVGEAPGADEERIGRPFVGAAGQLLDQCLHNAGIARGECYITNVVKERPRNNDISPFYGKKGWTKAGLDYVKELKSELETCGANIILAMGAVPLAALCDLQGITKWRGSILASTLLSGRKVLPIIHPAAALREYLYRFSIIADLKRARLESSHPDIRRVHRDYVINPSFEEAMHWLEKFSKEKPRLSTDIEIVNQELSCIGFATSPLWAISIPITGWSEREEMYIWQHFAKVLEDPDIPKLGQNFMFDITFLAKKSNIIVRGKIDDTMVAHGVCYPDFPKGLDFLCSIYAKEPYYKDDGKIWKNPHMSSEQFWTYNAKDCAITYDCWLPLEKELDKRNTRWAYDFTLSWYPFLIYMQMRGIKANRVALAEAKKLVIEKYTKLQLDLNKVVGYDLNPNSPKQCAEYFYIKKGIPPYVKTSIVDGVKVQSVTTDDKAMTRLARKGYKEAYYVQEIRGLKKLEGTYLDIEFDADDRLRCSYNVKFETKKDKLSGAAKNKGGASTGRLTSSQTIFGTGANLQNIPPEFKGFLVADEEMALVELDKRQAEWIVTAYMCGDVSMIEVAEKGLDAHVRTAHLMFGVPEDLIIKEDKIVGKTTDEFLIRQLREEQIPEVLKYNPPLSMSVRQGGKKSNHAFDYGLSGDGFSLQYSVPIAEGRRNCELYHKAYPAIRQWYQYTIDQLSKNRTLTNCFGRVRTFMDRWGDDLFKAAYAFGPQSTVSDLLNQGLRDSYADQSSFMQKVDSLGQVHDSYLFQYPINDIEGLAFAVLKMRDYLEPTLEYRGRSFTIPTDMKLGYNWAERKESDDGVVTNPEGMRSVKIVSGVKEFSENIKLAIHKG